jgi:hypothetical protein
MLISRIRRLWLLTQEATSQNLKHLDTIINKAYHQPSTVCSPSTSNMRLWCNCGYCEGAREAREVDASRALYAIKTLWPNTSELAAKDADQQQALYNIRSLWPDTSGAGTRATNTQISEINHTEAGAHTSEPDNNAAETQNGEFGDLSEHNPTSYVIPQTPCCDTLLCPIAFWRNLIRGTQETIRVLGTGEDPLIRFPTFPPTEYAATIVRTPNGTDMMQVTIFGLRIIQIVFFFMSWRRRIFRKLDIWSTHTWLAPDYLSLWVEVNFGPIGLLVITLFICFLFFYV